MPLYLVTRGFPGATKTDLDAAAFRSLNCLAYHRGLAWIRSFWNPVAETLTCVYEAQDPEQIRLHAQRADIPCDAVAEVEEVLPTDFVLEAEAVLAANRNRVTGAQ